MKKIFRLLTPVINRICPKLVFQHFFNRQNTRFLPRKKDVYFTLSFDVDTEQDVIVLDKLVNLLNTFSIKNVNFACVGELVEKYPHQHQQLISQRYAIINHGYRIHSKINSNGTVSSTRFYNNLTSEEIQKDIFQADEVIKKILFVPVYGFRVPHFGTFKIKNLQTQVYPILKKLNYVYSTSTMVPDVPGYGLYRHPDTGIEEIPLTCCPLHPFTVFDSWHILHSAKKMHDSVDFNTLFMYILSLTKKRTQSCLINLYFDPKDMVILPEFNRFLKSISDEIKQGHITMFNYHDLVNL